MGFLASMTAAVLVVIAMAVLAEYTKTRGRLLLTALVFAVYFFSSLGPVFLAQRRPDSAVSRVAMGAGVAALLLLLAGIWGTPNSDAFWKSTAILTLLGMVLAYIATLDIQPERLKRSIAAKSVAPAAFMACLGIAAGIKWPPYWWVFTLIVIVWGFFVLAPAVLYIIRRIQRR